MKKLLSAALLATTLSTPAFAFTSSVFFNTVELVQFGQTPDQVQRDVGFPLNNNPTSNSQVLSVIYNFNGWTWWTTHYAQGRPDPVWYGTLVQSHFQDNIYMKTVWYTLIPDTNNDPNVATLNVVLCSDDQCTDWLYAYALNAIPLDGDGGITANHSLQIFTNTHRGTADYAFDRNLASNNPDMPPMVVDTSANYGGSHFSLPIAGATYQVGCDFIWYDPAAPDPNYKTCIIGNMTQVFWYTGPYHVSATQDIVNAFSTTSPSGTIKATSLNHGLSVYGTLPTIHMGGDVDNFPNGNASWFAAQAVPEVLPYAVFPLTDSDGIRGQLEPSTWNPFP